MTEAEWLACADPEQMLAFLESQPWVSDRRMRLFGCACCRLVGHLLPDVRVLRAIQSSEQWADTEPRKKDENAARELDESWHEGLGQAAGLALMAMQCVVGTMQVRSSAIGPLTPATAVAPKLVARQMARWIRRAGSDSRRGENAAVKAGQLHLIRDIVGNPFRHHGCLPSWQAPAVRTIAEASYGDRIHPNGHLDNARLAVLSDALEEAGGADADMLAHLRSPGPHVRGCWALDLILTDCR